MKDKRKKGYIVSIKDYRDTSRKKLVLLGTFFSIGLIALFGKIIYIQQVHGAEYTRLAIEQSQRRQNSLVTIYPTRGNIFDANKQSLAISYAVDNVALNVSGMIEDSLKTPDKKKKFDKTLENLSLYLNMPIEEVQAVFATDASGAPVNNTKRYVIGEPIDRKVSAELMKSGVTGVYLEQVNKRNYTNDDVAPNVLGFIRGDAKYGLERQYDTELSGTNGKAYASNLTGQSSADEVAVDGYSINTTIDLKIQAIVEEAIKNSNAIFPAKTTSAVVMNPKTGEVLAMAQYPKFSNNKPEDINKIGDVSDTRFMTELAALDEADRINRLMQIWTNYNISSSIEPGSTYKPIVVAAALEENSITKSAGYFCAGTTTINGVELNCHLLSGHGNQTLTEVLANSCNIGMIEIIQKLGVDLYYKYHADFGFGEKTGIDLPDEASFAGVQYTKLDLNNDVQLATSSFGQGFNVTAIQSLSAFSAVINGGNLMKPYVVSQIVDNKNRVIRENVPTVVRKVVSKETSDYMRNALLSVVSETGTGRKAVIKGYKIGGKTGTAQQGVRHEDKSLDEYALSFIAYLPADDPEIIVFVVIDKPLDYQDNVTTPAPMMKEILLNIIKYKGYLPTSELAPEDDIHLEGETLVEMGDYAGMSTAEATHELNNLGFSYDIIGDGDVIGSQSDEPGVKVSKNSRVYLYPVKPLTRENLIFVPKVTDVSVEQAVEILANAGLVPVIGDYKKVEETLEQESDVTTNPEETQADASTATTEILGGQLVSEQMPSANVSVGAGTEIRLKIAN